MILQQEQADQLIRCLKEATRNKHFSWDEHTRYDEPFISVDVDGLKFILTLTRNPFEIKLHLRTAKDNHPLCRIDANPYHINPDGEEMTAPHLHYYREGYGLSWAKEIDWYNANDPLGTLMRFLDEVKARFPLGIQPSFA